MNLHTRDRAVLPIAIPLGSIAFIFVVAFGMSRVLLNVHPRIATSVALMVAFNILVACSFLALRTGFSKRDLVPMAGVVVLPLLIGAAVAVGVISVDSPEEHEPGPTAKVVAISANNLKFSASQLDVPANEGFEIEFDNQEAQPHNIWITDVSGATVLKESLITGPKTVKWDVPAIAPGEYPFKCEVHPTMAGKVVATAAADDHETAAGSEVAKISADDLKFDKVALEVKADTAFKLEFNNKEAQPHNVEILTAKGGEKLFTQPFITGPKKVAWDVPALKAGTYWFQCQVHPDMNGKVTAS